MNFYAFFEVNLMKHILSLILVITGILMCLTTLYPIFELNKGISEGVAEWEEIKNNQSKEEEVNDVAITDDLLGILAISDSKTFIPIRKGITTDILKKGIGLDETTDEIGEGNSVLFGHREEVLWDLKNVELGDKITIETLTKNYEFTINEIKVVDPNDAFIYGSSSEYSTPQITLVTCYPFVYMGPTPQRFVVKAHLIE